MSAPHVIVLARSDLEFQTFTVNYFFSITFPKGPVVFQLS